MFKKNKHKINKIKLSDGVEPPVELPTGNEFTLKGIPSSPGIAYGRVVVIKPESFSISNETISTDKIPSEIVRFELAVSKVIEEYYFLLNRVKKEAKDVFSVIETNLIILNDKFLLDSIKKRINSGFSAESAICQEFDVQKKLMKNAKDSVLRERILELDHIQESLLASLRDKQYYYRIAKDSIVVAQTVTPADLVKFKESGVIGIITEVGGISSHSSILARSFEIPEVIGIKEATSLVKNNAALIVDGYSGEIKVFPNDDTVKEYQSKKSRENEHKLKLGELIRLPAETTDRRRITLLANVDFPEDIESAVLSGAEGIGLVRSEYLMLTKQELPDEEQQYEIYNEIAERAYPNPVTFRVFDIGSDKKADGLQINEANPALGCRGIRFLLQNTEIFKTQVRAILRASRNRNVRIMLPMITGVNELIRSLEIINECKDMLVDRNLLFDNNVPVGIMIETPAAALLADNLADYAAFFSIGTNDLTQYTLAADRSNEYVSYIFDPFHPAVIKLLKMTVEAGRKKNIPVGICGELAGHAGATSLLIGLGFDELSVSPGTLLELKNRVRNLSFEEASKIADEVMLCSTYDEVRELLSIRNY